MVEVLGMMKGTSKIVRTLELLGLASRIRDERGVQLSHDQWMALLPPDGIEELTDDVYKAHVHEQIDRAAAGRSVDHPTDAELLCAFHAASLAAPLDQLGRCSYDALFRRVLPNAVLAEPPEPEPWVGAVDDELARLKATRVPRVTG